MQLRDATRKADIGSERSKDRAVYDRVADKSAVRRGRNSSSKKPHMLAIQTEGWPLSYEFLLNGKRAET